MAMGFCDKDDLKESYFSGVVGGSTGVVHEKQGYGGETAF